MPGLSTCDPLGGLATCDLVSLHNVRTQVAKYIYGSSTDHAGLHAICDLLMLIEARLERIEESNSEARIEALEATTPTEPYILLE